MAGTSISLKLRSSPMSVSTSSDFTQGFLSSQHMFKKEGKFTDFKLKLADGHTVHCHKIVLASVSPFFRAVFNSGMIECKDNEMTLQTLDPEVTKAILEYMYTGEICVEPSDFQGTFVVAEFLQLEELKTKCVEYFPHVILPENCIHFLYFTGLREMPEVVMKCKEVLCDHFAAIYLTEDFNELHHKDLSEAVQEDYLNVPNEDMVLEACIKWLQHDPQPRKQYMKEILGHVRTQYFTHTYLLHLVTSSSAKDLLAGLKFDSPSSVQERVVSSMKARPLYKQKKELVMITAAAVEASESNSPPAPSGLCWRYDPSSNTWKELTEVVTLKSHPAQAICPVTGGFATLGGYARPRTSLPSGFQVDQRMYNMKMNKWVKCPDMETARKSHTAVSMGHKMIITGGENSKYRCVGPLNRKVCFKSHVPTKEVSCFDYRTNKWSDCAELPEKIENGIYAAVWEDNIFVLATCKQRTDHVIMFMVYNVTRDLWMQLTPPPGLCQLNSTGTPNPVTKNGRLYFLVDLVLFEYNIEGEEWYRHLGPVWEGAVSGDLVLYESNILFLPLTQSPQSYVQVWNPDSQCWEKYDLCFPPDVILRGPMFVVDSSV